MAKYEYILLDVFTDRAFGGNQLAVFPHASGLSHSQMQAIANELNLAETTFVLPPENPQNNFCVKIFTPVVEMPMAGHPTIGTAFVVVLEKLITPQEDEITVLFEEKVGLIPVKIRLQNGVPIFSQMQQNPPEFGPVFEDLLTIARMLNLQPDDLVENLPVEVVSCGVPYLIVPLKNLDAVRKARLQPEILKSIQPQIKNANVYLFTTQTETGEAQLHSRMFWYEKEVTAEDAATGSASGPLGSYVVKHKIFGEALTQQFLNEQGFEMGRPSFIHIEIEKTSESISVVRVGGQAYYMGRGHLEV